MALTKTPIELSSTPSIVDGGNATAITIDSSENVSLANNLAFIAADGVELSAKESFQVTIDSDDNQSSRVFGVRSGASGSYESLITLSEASGAVFNEDGLAALDFRVESDNNTHILFVDAGNDRVNIGLDAPGSNSHKVVIQNESTVGTVNSHLCLVGDSATNGQGPQIMFSESGGGESFAGGSIGFARTGGNGVGDLIFGTRQSSGDSSTTTTEAMRILDNGDICFKLGSNQPSSSVVGWRYNDTDSDNPWVRQSVASTGGATHIQFANPNGYVGQILTSGSSTTYSTSSDYRLKENVNYTWDATTRLKQLKPARFNFIADKDTTVDGFLAHEVQDFIPEAIIGTKDAMTVEVLYVEGDELPEGKNIGDVKTASVPDYQGIDQSKLVPLLVKTIQELEARVTTLEG